MCIVGNLAGSYLGNIPYVWAKVSVEGTFPWPMCIRQIGEKIEITIGPGIR